MYSRGDEAAILELFKRVFQGERSLEHWEWKFKKNPYGPPVAVLAWDAKTRKLVGQYTVMPVRLNAMGKSVLACQSLDTMVDPHYRMHGIFEKSARQCFEHLKESKFELVYGFPNRNSYPGFVRKLGWMRVSFLNGYSLRLTIDRSLKRFRLGFTVPVANAVFRLCWRTRLLCNRVITARNLRGAQVSSSERVPSEYEALWMKEKSYEVLSLWKDVEYFSWRYDQHPEQRFQYLLLREQGKLTGLSVIHESEDSIEILELIVADRRIDRAKLLVNFIARHALDRKVSRVEFNGKSLGFFDDIFSPFRKETLYSHVLCLGKLRETIPSEILFNSENWTVTNGDSDKF